jgi:hypothetical protein
LRIAVLGGDEHFGPVDGGHYEGNFKQSSSPYVGLLFHGLSTVNAVYLQSENYEGWDMLSVFFPVE